ncbi:MAG TPA: chromate transporter [Bacteroidaceae bacterium]|nr:chromate transporter [Bacteroidaceae bacterium]
MILWKLFFTFFQIGLFGFGGGYGMLSMIEHEIVRNHKWLSISEFTDIVAISQMTPGPIGINSATYVGYTAMINSGYPMFMATFGSLLSSFAVILPSFILMLSISVFFLKYKNHSLIQLVMNWLRPVIVGFLAAATLALMNKENFGCFRTQNSQLLISSILFVLSFIATHLKKWNPIFVIVIAGTIGGLFYSFF